MAHTDSYETKPGGSNARKNSEDAAILDDTVQSPIAINSNNNNESDDGNDGGFGDALNRPARNLTGRNEPETVRHRTNVRREDGPRNSRLEHIHELEHQQQEEEESIYICDF